VNKELILKRASSTVIANLNVEFIRCLLRDVFGQKKRIVRFFNKYKHFFDLFVLVCCKKMALMA